MAHVIGLGRLGGLKKLTTKDLMSTGKNNGVMDNGENLHKRPAGNISSCRREFFRAGGSKGITIPVRPDRTRLILLLFLLPSDDVQHDLQHGSLTTFPKEENLGNKRKPMHHVYSFSVPTFGLSTISVVMNQD